MPFCSVSIIDFEQVNVGWGFIVFIINFEHILSTMNLQSLPRKHLPIHSLK